MYLLDTNVISELRKAKSAKADPHVLAWAASINTEALFISVITLTELEIGVRQMERRDAEQGQRLRSWLDGSVLPTFRERILPVDESIALRCAALHVPDRLSDRDAIIASTALEHGMTVVTRNTSDFESAGVSLFNPWKASVI